MKAYGLWDVDTWGKVCPQLGPTADAVVQLLACQA